MKQIHLALACITAAMCLSACNIGTSSSSKTTTSSSRLTTTSSKTTSSSKTQSAAGTTSSSSQATSVKSSSSVQSSSSSVSSSTTTSSEKTYSLISGTLAMSFPTYAPDTISGRIKPGSGITVSGSLPVSECVFSGAKSNQSGKAAFVNSASLEVYWNRGVIFRSALLDLQCTTKVKGSVQLVSGNSADNKAIAANSYSSISFTDTATKGVSYITSFNFSGDFSATGDFVVILSKIAFNVLA